MKLSVLARSHRRVPTVTGVLPLMALLCCQPLVNLSASAQVNRPIPYPAFPSPQFVHAVEAGTRTLTGVPGDAYWTNRAEYRIDATLSPYTNMLRGTEEIVYHNSSPDTLRRIVVNLYQNLHAEGVVRSEAVEVTGGMSVSRVALNGVDLVESRPVSPWRRQRGPISTSYSVIGTTMIIQVPDGVAPGSAARLNLSWSFTIPERGAPRMGQDGDVYYLGYWYPQVAVYDDLSGWDMDPYAGEGEFYMGYADYEVAITLPHGWLVGATGVLQNPHAVLTEQTRNRLASASTTDSVVQVVTADERVASISTAESATGALTWRFKADNVRDFAFGASASYVWDATRARVGDLDGDGTTDYAAIHSLYRPDARTWDKQAGYAAYSIDFLSRTVMPYPYPQMTSVEGIIGGGMEYPMITLIGGNRDESRLMSVTIHELAHMWFPMIVGQDEKAYTWM
ncbi:MAG: M1 family metallopeptidase, partial [Rhodothermales bacterium]|nr:M1 family metallopeptidase [Rhodothermales bacterium]